MKFHIWREHIILRYDVVISLIAMMDKTSWNLVMPTLRFTGKSKETGLQCFVCRDWVLSLSVTAGLRQNGNRLWGRLSMKYSNCGQQCTKQWLNQWKCVAIFCGIFRNTVIGVEFVTKNALLLIFKALYKHLYACVELHFNGSKAYIYLVAMHLWSKIPPT